MNITMIACDNPECNRIGQPEYVSKKTTRPPYGWWRVQAYAQGTIATVTVDTCSVECIAPAVHAAASTQRGE